MLMERRPFLSHARCEPAVPGVVLDQNGQPMATQLPGERALTIYLDKREIVTLMTLGQNPEALVLGYLRNQRLIDDIRDIAELHVSWEVSVAAVSTYRGDAGERCEDLLLRRTVTSGCGQGTQFGNALERLQPLHDDGFRVARSTVFALLEQVRQLDTVYKRCGAVHGCVLADSERILHHVEDIGRNNAVDSISGLMWLEGRSGNGAGSRKLFYTTGRLTSEMVIKTVEMGIPVLISRSGTTERGLDIARHGGLTLIGRAWNERFLVFNGSERIDFTK
ncbi:formate dehydrogenase accessory sulfurtransferase FdhD [Aromatoleum sp.]|uniref:formate dehydrogenase accessory sulfurtransferase FdhD n=1 Tax=Aromatoleum sp. TaxID=2307007 RepID=UPI002FCA5EE0